MLIVSYSLRTLSRRADPVPQWLKPRTRQSLCTPKGLLHQDDPVRPPNQIPHNLLPIRLIEQLMPRLRIETMLDVLKACCAIRSQHLLKLLRVPTDRVAASGNYVDRQSFGNSCALNGTRSCFSTIEQINPELHTSGKSAQRIANIFVHLTRIT